MAADLAADLAEAEADGASPEQVLGSGAFDPRAFAAAWARERGVARPLPVPVDPGQSRYPPPVHWLPRPARIRAAIAAAAVVLTLGAGLAILASRTGETSVVAAAAGTPQPQPQALAPRPFALQVGPPGDGRRRAIGALVLLVGGVGLVVAMLYWSPWTHPRRSSRRYPPIDDHPGGPGY
jgi:hypothetical protein